MGSKSILAYTFIIIPLLVAAFIIINPSILISGGYDLAVDGYVISRTLMFIFLLNLLFKLGLFLAKKKDK